MADHQQTSQQSWKVALVSGLVFGVLFGVMRMIVPPHPHPSLSELLIFAAIAGILFGVFIKLFLSSKSVARTMAIALQPGETVAHEGFANHFLNCEGRGGRLYLTNRRLVFQPHAVNLQRSGFSMPLDDIAEASKCLTFWLIPNGIKITHRDGKTERFVVYDRADWLAGIATQKLRDGANQLASSN
jgi:hypothetical protein